MAEERDRCEWRRTTSVLSLIANCHRDPKRRPSPWVPDDFDPYVERRVRVQLPIAALKMFVASAVK